MKLDHPSMFAFEHSAGGFGMPDTPTSDEGTYVGGCGRLGPIALCSDIGAPLLERSCCSSVSSLSALSRSLSSCSRSVDSARSVSSARASEWGPSGISVTFTSHLSQHLHAPERDGVVRASSP
jgi:hypothetical protein